MCGGGGGWKANVWNGATVHANTDVLFDDPNLNKTSWQNKTAIKHLLLALSILDQHQSLHSNETNIHSLTPKNDMY